MWLISIDFASRSFNRCGGRIQFGSFAQPFVRGLEIPLSVFADSEKRGADRSIDFRFALRENILEECLAIFKRAQFNQDRPTAALNCKRVRVVR